MLPALIIPSFIKHEGAVAGEVRIAFVVITVDLIAYAVARCGLRGQID